jgi:putative FmdB family regulatory protein
MPLYEYKCASCEKVFEVIQKFSDPELTTHPGCGGAVKRLLSKTSFHLKGSGWYATDYGKSTKSNGSTPKKDKKEDSKESKPAATESKPASTPASDKK